MIKNAGLIVQGPYLTSAPYLQTSVYLAYSGTMTNEMCMTFCLSNGFVYSGTINQ